MEPKRQGRRRCSVREYLDDQADGGDRRDEYHKGTAVPVAEASPVHDRIVRDLIRAVQIRTHHDVFGRDVCVRVGPTTYMRPDVGVVADPAFGPEYTDVALVNPLVLAEVSSPESELADCSWRFAGYRDIAGLGEFILVAENRPQIEPYFVRDGHWYIPGPVQGVENVVHLRSIGIDLPLAEVYDGVTFVPLPKPSCEFSTEDEGDGI